MTYLEGVYWDLDGTIANTELEAHLPAFNFAFKSAFNFVFTFALLQKTSPKNTKKCKKCEKSASNANYRQRDPN